MNWARIRHFPWVDTRARFVAQVPERGTLLDLGSSDGETLGHIHELRPDLKLAAADIAGSPANYPSGCDFRRTDLEKQPLPWPDASVDAVTCMHLVEHLEDLSLLVKEVGRVLRPGGAVYFETPHPRSLTMASPRGTAAGMFTLNFYDDPTHTRLVGIGALAQKARSAGLQVEESGTSRNWLFAAIYPVLFFAPPSRKKFTAKIHWAGWSAFLKARRPW